MTDALLTPAADVSPEAPTAIGRLAAWMGQSHWSASQHVQEPPPSSWTLDQIGAESEEIKNRCIDLVRKIDDVSAIREHFIEISNWIGHVLESREQTTTALVERGMMIALTEGALADLKAEARDLYDSREALRAENNLLVTENERLKASARVNGARLEASESDLREIRDAAAHLHNALESERAQVAYLKGELDDLQDVLERNDALISQLQLDVASARDEGAFARQHAEMLQSSLLENQEQGRQLQRDCSESKAYAAALVEKIREMEIALDSERRQRAKIEELLAATQAEHQKSLTRWRVEHEEARRRIAEQEARADETAARAQAADRLLAELRAELQSRVDQCRASERQTQEAEQRLLRLSEQSEAAGGEMARLREKLGAGERAHARLRRRARSLIRALRDRAASLEKSEQRALLVGERLAAEASRFEAQKEQFEQAIRDLAEQLEKERAANRVTAGALEAARQQRLMWRDESPAHDEPRLADILARAEEAHKAAEAANYSP